MGLIMDPYPLWCLSQERFLNFGLRLQRMTSVSMEKYKGFKHDHLVNLSTCGNPVLPAFG